MKYIKFIMSKGGDFVLPEDQARKILESSAQMVMIHDLKGKWEGSTINKAHIVSTKVDHFVADKSKLIEQPKEPQISEEQIKKNKQKLQEMRADLEKKGILPKKAKK